MASLPSLSTAAMDPLPYPFSAAAVQDPSHNKDIQDDKLSRPLVSIYARGDYYSKEDVISAVESCMKKHADNLLRSLEGIGGRLSQLELYCYKLEKSIGQLRIDMIQDHSEADLKLNSVESHLQELNRTVQILRDKQELVEAQKELAQLQLVQETVHKNEERVISSVLESMGNDDRSQVENQELALVPLPQEGTVQSIPLQYLPYKDLLVWQSTPVPVCTQQEQRKVNQTNVYYVQSQNTMQLPQMPSSKAAVEYVQPEAQVQDTPTHPLVLQPQSNQAPQVYNQQQKEWSRLPLQQFQSQVLQSQAQAVHLQQSNTLQLPTEVGHQQLPSSPASTRTQSPPSYQPYLSHRPANPTPGAFPGSMAVLPPYTAISSQPNHRQVMLPCNGGQGSTASLPPAQHMMLQQQQQQLQPPLSQSSVGPYMSKGGQSSIASYTIQGNMQSHDASSYRYPTSSVASTLLYQQAPPSDSAVIHSGTHTMHNHRVGEMLEKAVNVGYPRDQVESTMLRLAAAGQPIDLSGLIHSLNGAGVGAFPQA